MIGSSGSSAASSPKQPASGTCEATAPSTTTQGTHLAAERLALLREFLLVGQQPVDERQVALDGQLGGLRRRAQLLLRVAPGELRHPTFGCAVDLYWAYSQALSSSKSGGSRFGLAPGDADFFAHTAFVMAFSREDGRLVAFAKSHTEEDAPPALEVVF